MMVAFLWIACALMDLPNFVGWSRHSYDMKGMVCTYDRTADYGYTLFFIVLVIAFPVVVVAMSYLRIFLYVRRQKNRIAAIATISSEASKKLKKSDIQLMKTMFTIFVVFLICWSPYAVTVLADYHDNFPMEVHSSVLMLAHVNSSVNSVLYGVLNKQYRKAYKTVILRILCCLKRSKVRSEIGSQGTNESFSYDATVYTMAIKPPHNKTH